MCRTLREADMRGEKVVKEFLIRYFYDRIRNDGILKKIRDHRPIYDVERQLQGMDTILYCHDGRELIIDEKSALSYVNSRLATFAFEIRWSRYGRTTDGWFIDDDLRTQYYFTMWLTSLPIFDEHTGKRLKKYDHIQYMTADHLTHIELYAINKQKLRDYLRNEFGLTVEVMKERAAQLVADGSRESCVNDKIKFVYSQHLAERPVNLVINKSVLRQVADALFEITPHHVKRNGRMIYGTP